MECQPVGPHHWVEVLYPRRPWFQSILSFWAAWMWIVINWWVCCSDDLRSTRVEMSATDKPLTPLAYYCINFDLTSFLWTSLSQISKGCRWAVHLDTKVPEPSSLAFTLNYLSIPLVIILSAMVLVREDDHVVNSPNISYKSRLTLRVLAMWAYH